MEVTVESSHVTLRLIILEMRASVSLTEKKQKKHVACTFVIDLSVAALQSESSHSQNTLSLVGFYKRKWLKTTYTHTRTSAFTYRKTSLTIGCCLSVTVKEI